MDYAGPNRIEHQLELVNALLCLVTDSLMTGGDRMADALLNGTPGPLLDQLQEHARVLSQSIHAQYAQTARSEIGRTVQLMLGREPHLGVWNLLLGEYRLSVAAVVRPPHQQQQQQQDQQQQQKGSVLVMARSEMIPALEELIGKPAVTPAHMQHHHNHRHHHHQQQQIYQQQQPQQPRPKRRMLQTETVHM